MVAEGFTAFKYVEEAFKLECPAGVPAEKQLVYIYTAYLDESGTHDGAESLAVAGFLSVANSWVDFSARWQLALNDFGLDYFHMSDFANRVGPYATWNEQERRARLTRLLGIISNSTVASVATCLSVPEVEEIFSARAKAMCGGAYGLAAIATFMSAADVVSADESIDGTINYVFESGARGAGQIAAVYNANVRDPVQKDQYRLGSLRFDDKRMFLPLQAADILAYEVYKNWRRERAAREKIEHEKAEPRFPLVALAAQPHHWGMLSAEELRKWHRVLTIRLAAEDQGLVEPLK